MFIKVQSYKVQSSPDNYFISEPMMINSEHIICIRNLDATLVGVYRNNTDENAMAKGARSAVHMGDDYIYYCRETFDEICAMLEKKGE